MRYFASPQFSAKLSPLSLQDRSRVSEFLGRIDTSQKQKMLRGDIGSVKLLEGDIYVANLGSVSIYFTFGNDSNKEEYVLLLDATARQTSRRSVAFFAAKDPRMNSALNPNINAALNPMLNSQLNPRINSAINPVLNPQLNPRLNASINPRLNSSLNYRLNASINPALNPSLNPRFNSSINPRINSAFGGPYLYTNSLVQDGYIVHVNEMLELVFDISGSHSGELVTANEWVQVQFDSNNDWIAYTVRATENVRIRYDQSGNWIGMIV